MEIKNILDNLATIDSEEVEVYGWVRNRRLGKKVSFLVINDGTCFQSIQVVFKAELAEQIGDILVGSAVKITGIVKVTIGGKQDLEIEASNCELISQADDTYPIQPKKHTYEFLREKAHLRARTNTFHAVFRIRSLLSFAVHDYFNKHNFVHLHSPIITSTDAEGAGEMFQVTTLDMEELKSAKEDVDYSKDFFKKKTSLTVSGQLLAESYAHAFSKVYTFGPTFRAEKSNTTRHIAEFWMIEPEIAFADLQDNMQLAKDMLIYVVNYVLEQAPQEIAFLDEINQDINLQKRLEELVNAKFEEITYTEAIEILQEAQKNGKKFEMDVSWGIDLATEHERYLTDEKFKAPVFVTDYPRDIKAFYMRRNDDGKTVGAMDLLVAGIGELLGGSEREERRDYLDEVLKKHNLDNDDYKWYKEIVEYGGVRHAGFGIGFERLVMYVTAMENIRDVIPFPRVVGVCDY